MPTASETAAAASAMSKTPTPILRVLMVLLSDPMPPTVVEYMTPLSRKLGPMQILERIERISALGDRPGYSAAEDEAHDLAAEWMSSAGLEVSRDDAGNLFGRRGDARVWTGSHLDSVPNGGKYDGVLGSLAGIEAAAALPDAPLAVVVFRAEETGPMGSKRLTELPDAFLELHIEQGPVLERAGEPLGVVTAIAGQTRGLVVFEGRADHAGTTPMDVRDDAFVKAARFVLHVQECARDGAVATVGAVEVEPNAMNVVPARVTVAVDARAPTVCAARRARRGDRLRAGVAPRSGRDERRTVRDAERAAPGCAEAHLRRRPRRDGARGSGRADRNALRAQPERRRQSLTGGAHLGRGHRAGRRRADGDAPPSIHPCDERTSRTSNVWWQPHRHGDVRLSNAGDVTDSERDHIG